MAREIVAYLATSVDGFIAREDGAVDWLDRPQPKGAYGMPAFLRSVDTVVWGRATFEMGRRLGTPVFPGKRNIVVSRTLAPADVAVGAELWRGGVKRLAARLRSETSAGDVWLMGGARLFAGFLDADALDRLILHVVPVLIGAGIPLLAPARRTAELVLVSSRRFSDGVVRLEYRPAPGPAAAVHGRARRRLRRAAASARPHDR